MKNVFFLSVLAILCGNTPVVQAQQQSSDGMDFIEQFVEDEENAAKARHKSKDLLNAKPEILKLRENEENLLIKKKKKREELAKKIDEKKYMENKKKIVTQEVTTHLKKAPFGLYWDATKEQMETMEFTFSKSERENYEGVYLLQNPQQKYTMFNPVIAIFGLQDHLWCIYAQSIPQTDKPDASKILRLYHQYYEALKKKYGNDKEIFTPYTYVEEKLEGQEPEQKIVRITHQNPLGGDNFLEELQTGKASLYATFDDGSTGVTLSVAVDDNKKSFIVIDYKDLSVMHKEKDTNIENLMDDL